MRWIKTILLLLCLVSTHTLAEESSSGGLMSFLQRLGVSSEQTEQELLPPDEAFKLSLEVRDDRTLIARLTPAKDYYLYRDKINFESKSAGIHIDRITLPPGKMKLDPAFGQTEVYYQPLEAVISLRRDASAPEQLSLSATYQGCNEPVGVCYAPINKVNDLLLPSVTAAIDAVADTVSGDAQAAESAGTDAIAELFQADNAPLFETESYKIERLFASGNFWLILSGFFGIGLLLAFTPCVFPMFPILSGIIASKGQQMSKLRGFMLALAYVLGMAITYAIAGAAAGLSGTMLSAALQNAWVLGTFALIFVALAFSMFGFYELQMPSFIQNRLVEETGHFKGDQLTGVFGMGALSALIVSPCVAAPLAGALIYISQTRDVVLGGSALFIMALGMGMPLLLLGVSAGALLPKSGAWMKSVQQFFGVLLLAVAIWLVSPVITEVVHMLLWATLLIISAIYLHALDPLPGHASGLNKFLKGIGVIALLVGIALLIGVLSGSRDILQPLSKFTLAATTSFDQLAKPSVSTNESLPFKQVKTTTELDELIQQAKGRYVMIDFYADWCISCKEMERFTFTDPQVQARLKNVELVQINVTDGTPDDAALLKRFKLFGPPGILFFDRQGVEIPNIKIIGYLDKRDFVTVLDAILL
ncbi:protein-disulfide reductase DsbD [Nitrosomonas sp.]|uniref:protein-disulfide reductase DsbD n=1 Tax=Nitrosomonas sp. TaxID=42353 RepID=UPI00330617E6